MVVFQALTSIVVLAAWYFLSLTSAQVPIPNKPLGFVYGNGSHDAPIHIDVFLDLACPDSKVAFPVMKQVAAAYGSQTVRIKFFIFPLPYHRSAHIAAIVRQPLILSYYFYNSIKPMRLSGTRLIPM